MILAARIRYGVRKIGSIMFLKIRRILSLWAALLLASPSALFNNEYKHKIYGQASLLAVACAYCRPMLRIYIYNLRLSSPSSFVKSLRMIWLIHKVRRYTGIFVPQLADLYKLCENINRQYVSGDVVECGVYNGGSAALLAYVCCKQSSLNREIWLFD